MDTIGVNLQAVKQRIISAAMACGRDHAQIGLIAVSKTFSANAISTAYSHGQHAFGENYVQEALAKIAALRHLDLNWHFIGPIQSNKTRAIAENFAWVHSIDRLKIAQRLAAARAPDLPPLQVCIQVNVGDESTKSGIAASEALALARAVAALPHLRLRGLMAVPPVTSEPALQRQYCAELRRLQEKLVASGLALDTLSMGMSGDLEAAIMEGATLVRIGTAIFGTRTNN